MFSNIIISLIIGHQTTKCYTLLTLPTFPMAIADEVALDDTEIPLKPLPVMPTLSTAIRVSTKDDR